MSIIFSILLRSIGKRVRNQSLKWAVLLTMTAQWAKMSFVGGLRFAQVLPEKKYCDVNKDKSSIFFFNKDCSDSTRQEIKKHWKCQMKNCRRNTLVFHLMLGPKEGCFKYLKDRIWNWKRVRGVGDGALQTPSSTLQPYYGLLCKFWWGSKKGGRKTTWMSWEVITQPKLMGGMCFRDIELFNLTLLAKQA